MEDRARIQQMLKDGKINSEQAVLLLNALKESGKKKDRIFKQVIENRQKRDRNMWMFIAGWTGIVFCVFIAFVLIVSRHEGHDRQKAMKYFNQGGFFLSEKDYSGATSVIEKGVRKAEELPGYTFLASVNRLQYEETGNPMMKEKETEAFRKAEALRKKIRRSEKMNNAAVVFGFIFLIFVVSVVMIIFLLIYNHLVNREEKVNQSMAQIRTMYQRKLDLIPALLEVAKIYLGHEKATLQDVTNARVRAVNVAENVKSNGESITELLESAEEVGGSLGRLLAVVEKYPDLKADVHFITIQDQLEKTEDLLARERSVYNRRVRGLNASLRSFPANIISGMFQFESRGYYELEQS